MNSPAVARVSAPLRVDAPDQAQTQRFELKYLVNEAQTRAMRQFVRCHLKPDEFASRSADYAYPVHSLYLDSADLALYGATEDGERNRFKLRVRFYDEDSRTPVFFEVKRRTNECISKLRAKVRRDAVRPLLEGEWPQLRHLQAPDGKQLFALQEFCRLMRVLGATPRSHVAYRREAWMSPIDNSMRVTFDRQVRCEPQFGAALRASVSANGYVEPFETQVIFELKFTNRMPTWCGELIRTFGLVRGGAAKYAEGVVRLGEHRLSSRNLGVTLVKPGRPREAALWSGATIGAA